MSSSTFVRVAITVATTSAMYFVFSSHRGRKRTNVPEDVNSRTALKEESLDDGIRTTLLDPATKTTLQIGQSSKDEVTSDHSIALHKLASSANDNTTGCCTMQGNSIGGAISPKQGVINAEGMVSALLATGEEPRILTLSLVDEDGMYPSAEVTIKVDEKKVCFQSPVVPEIVEESKTMEKYTPSRRARPSLSRCNSFDGVIMISKEDLIMVEQLLLQMHEDEELFDCGDEMTNQMYPRPNTKSWHAPRGAEATITPPRRVSVL